MIWFWILILLLALLIVLLPNWPHMRERDVGFGPSGFLLLVILILLFSWWVGWIAFWHPWHTPGGPMMSP